MTAVATVAQAIDWRTVEDALYDWFSTSTGLETVWEDQRAPQPTYPYASLNVLPGTSPMGAQSEHITEADGSITMRRQRDFTLSCQVHVGPTGANTPECHARTLVDTAIMTLDSPVQAQLFSSAGIGIRGPLGEPQDLDLEISGEWISRTRVDIRFGVASTLNIAPGYFEKIGISSRLAGLNTDGDPAPLDLDDETFDPTNP